MSAIYIGMVLGTDHVNEIADMVLDGVVDVSSTWVVGVDITSTTKVALTSKSPATTALRRRLEAQRQARGSEREPGRVA
jgi:hypothetical protein